jgi:hypothetical protein
LLCGLLRVISTPERIQLSVEFVAGVDRGDGLTWGLGRPVIIGRPRVPVLFSDHAVKYVIASALCLGGGVNDELGLIAELLD